MDKDIAKILIDNISWDDNIEKTLYKNITWDIIGNNLDKPWDWGTLFKLIPFQNDEDWEIVSEHIPFETIKKKMIIIKNQKELTKLFKKNVNKLFEEIDSSMTIFDAFIKIINNYDELIEPLLIEFIKTLDLENIETDLQSFLDNFNNFNLIIEHINTINNLDLEKITISEIMDLKFYKELLSFLKNKKCVNDALLDIRNKSIYIYELYNSFIDNNNTSKRKRTDEDNNKLDKKPRNK